MQNAFHVHALILLWQRQVSDAQSTGWVEFMTLADRASKVGAAEPFAESIIARRFAMFTPSNCLTCNSYRQVINVGVFYIRLKRECIFKEICIVLITIYCHQQKSLHMLISCFILEFNGSQPGSSNTIEPGAAACTGSEQQRKFLILWGITFNIIK